MAPNPRRKREAEKARLALSRELMVYARLVQRGRFRRRIQLTGDLEMLIAYDARLAGTLWGAPPQAVVRVDDVEVAQTVSRLIRDAESGWSFEALGRHQLSFMLRTRLGMFPATIHAEIDSSGFLSKLSRFRLVLGELTLYDERPGTIDVISPPSLPRPAAVSTQSDLPLAADPPELPTDLGLPLAADGVHLPDDHDCG